ncbi:MAG: type II toxin-antitoxin system death-on-curing family toxin [Patescibacteria group bacterium]|nr:type II toxin-antitoxin system death-on-curing family toxin [Patescibacteria group bacterium]
MREVEYTAFRLAKELMAWDEPIPDFGTRFPNILESCLETPFQTFNRKPLYKRLVGKAAALFYLMIKNHPFENGNKRIAVMSTIVFIAMNGKWLSVSDKQLYRIAVDVAESDPKQKDKYMDLLTVFFRENIKAI